MTTQTRPSRRQLVVYRRSRSVGVVLAVTALLSLGLVPASAAEPSSLAPEAATSAGILIVSLDSRGTDPTDDDVLLDGVSFSVRVDDGDRVFDETIDALAFGPTPAAGGLLDTAMLGPGWYWVQAASPDGYQGPPAILVELNTDASRTCVWDASGLVECQANDAGAEGLSWTMVLVRNTPSASPTETPTEAPTSAPTNPTTAPTGAVEGTTGRPVVTLPPTDVLAAGREPSSTPAVAWVVVLLIAISLLAAWISQSARASTSRRSGPRRD